MFIKFKQLEGGLHVHIHTDAVVAVREHSPRTAIIDCVGNKTYFVVGSANEVTERIHLVPHADAYAEGRVGMKKFYDIDHDKKYTEDELRADYELRKRNGEIDPVIYDTFEYYLESCMTRNNGSLEEIAPDYEIESRRRWAATKIAFQSEMEYEEILNVLQKWDVFGTWTMYEILNRPTDIDELQECVEQELGVR